MIILGYPGIFSQTLSLTRASVSSPGQNPGMHKWQNAYRKVSQDLGSFQKDFCGIFFSPPDSRSAGFSQGNEFLHNSQQLPRQLHPEAFLEPHIPTLSPNTGFCSVTASNSSEKVQMSCWPLEAESEPRAFLFAHPRKWVQQVGRVGVVSVTAKLTWMKVPSNSCIRPKARDDCSGSFARFCLCPSMMTTKGRQFCQLVCSFVF